MNPTLEKLLKEYAADHQHPMNRATHKIGVPLVLFHILAMLDWVHLFPFAIHTAGDGSFVFSLGHLFGLIVFSWYLVLDRFLGVLVALASIVCFLIAPFTSFEVVIGITILAWVFQFIGHFVYEKKSPSFFQNLVQLLVGPLFIAAILSGRTTFLEK